MSKEMLAHAKAAMAIMIAGAQRNGLLKPTLWASLGIMRAVGMATQKVSELMTRHLRRAPLGHDQGGGPAHPGVVEEKMQRMEAR
jgi:hypothetical protein